MAKGQALDARASGNISGRRSGWARAGLQPPSHPSLWAATFGFYSCLHRRGGSRTTQQLPPFSAPLPLSSSHPAPAVSPASPAALAPPPAPPLPFASQDALRGPGRKSASSRVCVCVCLCLEAARGPGQTLGNPV